MLGRRSERVAAHGGCEQKYGGYIADRPQKVIVTSSLFALHAGELFQDATMHFLVIAFCAAGEMRSSRITPFLSNLFGSPGLMPFATSRSPTWPCEPLALAHEKYCSEPIRTPHADYGAWVGSCVVASAGGQESWRHYTVRLGIPTYVVDQLDVGVPVWTSPSSMKESS